MDTWRAPAAWHLVTGTMTEIFCALANTEPRMLQNSGVVIAACMFPQTGTMERLKNNIFRKDDRLKRCFFKKRGVQCSRKKWC